MAFNQETADKVCERLAAGESLNAICKEDGFPAESTVRRWAMLDVEGFAANYTRARELQAHYLADQIITISDTTLEGEETTIKADGSRETKIGDMLGHRKLQVDSRKWYLSKVLPKVYGDKMETTHKGSVGVTMQATDADEKL